MLAACTPQEIVVNAPAMGAGEETNLPPAIMGSPPASTEAGTNFSFTPAADDPDGDALSWSISGKPAWASFDPVTGTLSGIPPGLGNFPDIEIKVTDGKASRVL